MEPWSWLISEGHWKTLSPFSVLAALLTWLSRRRGRGPLDWLARRANLEKDNKLLRGELRSCAETNARLLTTIETLTDASAAVVRASQAGLLTTSSGSSPAPSTTPANSSPSRRRRKPNRPGTRSGT